MELQTWHRLKLAGIKSQLRHLCLFLQLFPHNSHRAAFSPSQDLLGGYMCLIALLLYNLGPIVAESVALVTCKTASCFATTWVSSILLLSLWTVSTWAAYPQLSQIPNSPHHLWAYPVRPPPPPPPLVFPVLPLQPLLQPLPQLVVWKAAARGPCHLIWDSLRTKMFRHLLLSQ